MKEGITSSGDYKMKKHPLPLSGRRVSVVGVFDSEEALCAILGGEASMKKRRNRLVASISAIEGYSGVDDDEISHVFHFVDDEESSEVHHFADDKETSDGHHLVDDEDGSDVHHSVDDKEFSDVHHSVDDEGISDVHHSVDTQIETINGLVTMLCNNQSNFLEDKYVEPEDEEQY